MEEVFYSCPYCYSEVSILIDTSVPDQQYIEDCERCCNPTEFTVKVNGVRKLQSFEAAAIGQ